MMRVPVTMISSTAGACAVCGAACAACADCANACGAAVAQTIRAMVDDVASAIALGRCPKGRTKALMEAPLPNCGVHIFISLSASFSLRPRLQRPSGEDVADVLGREIALRSPGADVQPHDA